jgi:hypothetical protein
MPGTEAIIEIRPVVEAEDFGAELTPELRAKEQELRRPQRSTRQASAPPSP